MRYRAVLHDPEQQFERTIQILTNHMSDIESWVPSAFAKYGASTQAYVRVYETSEKQIRVFRNHKPATVESQR